MDPRYSIPTIRKRNEAIDFQAEIASKIHLTPEYEEPSLIAAVDTAYGDNGELVFASVVVTTFPEIEIVERASYYSPVTFPYLPGLLFFREGTAIIEAFKKLRETPQLLIVHGQGIAHPKQCGMACHLGHLYDVPAIGCSRKLIAGRHRDLPEQKGSAQPIILRGREAGVAYRSKEKVKPIFISPAFRCNLEQARDLVVRNLRGYRQPEPLRLAHLFANKFKRLVEKKGGPRPIRNESIYNEQ